MSDGIKRAFEECADAKTTEYPNAWRGSSADPDSRVTDFGSGDGMNDMRGREHTLKDSGARRQFETGAVRDRGVGDDKKYRRYDLLPRLPLYRYARHMGRGAAKYAARNWEKGMPLSEFYNSAMDHMLKYACGFDDEDHLAAAMWNIGCLIEGEDRIRRGMWPKELDDIAKTFNGMEP